MPDTAVLNVDLADVWKGAGPQNCIRTIAWGDEITVVSRPPPTSKSQSPSSAKKPDGSILPESITGYIEPTKSSGIKVSDVVRPWQTTKS
ncbi:MAG: hypothetical protein KF854_04650 [Nitrospira sp.]|nr:hypothetical protein [Nitrospira sp.]